MSQNDKKIAAVSINPVEVGAQKIFPVSISYSLVTQLVRDEIQRLADKYRGQHPEEDAEIYLDWAYGVYLGWKAIVGTNASIDDAKQLEALATAALKLDGTPF